jgi:hypothetical protein
VIWHARRSDRPNREGEIATPARGLPALRGSVEARPELDVRVMRRLERPPERRCTLPWHRRKARERTSPLQRVRDVEPCGATAYRLKSREDMRWIAQARQQRRQATVAIPCEVEMTVNFTERNTVG